MSDLLTLSMSLTCFAPSSLRLLAPRLHVCKAENKTSALTLLRKSKHYVDLWADHIDTIEMSGILELREGSVDLQRVR